MRAFSRNDVQDICIEQIWSEIQINQEEKLLNYILLRVAASQLFNDFCGEWEVI
jgi:hypothetical protein